MTTLLLLCLSLFALASCCSNDTISVSTILPCVDNGTISVGNVSIGAGSASGSFVVPSGSILNCRPGSSAFFVGNTSLGGTVTIAARPTFWTGAIITTANGALTIMGNDGAETYNIFGGPTAGYFGTLNIYIPSYDPAVSRTFLLFDTSTYSISEPHVLRFPSGINLGSAGQTLTSFYEGSGLLSFLTGCSGCTSIPYRWTRIGKAVTITIPGWTRTCTTGQLVLQGFDSNIYDTNTYESFVPVVNPNSAGASFALAGMASGSLTIYFLSAISSAAVPGYGTVTGTCGTRTINLHYVLA